ncbi:AVAST type 1 anti-phage system protein Avs1c [Janthinobacterium aestuarii]
MMETPDTRAEFELRLNFLREIMKQGKLQGPSNLDLRLEEVRLLPNGRVDLPTINEMARLNANMTYNMSRGPMKKWLEKSRAEHGEGSTDGV